MMDWVLFEVLEIHFGDEVNVWLEDPWHINEIPVTDRGHIQIVWHT